MQTKEQVREYILIDSDTDLVYGPYDSLSEARSHADSEELNSWEILVNDSLVDWHDGKRRLVNIEVGSIKAA